MDKEPVKEDAEENDDKNKLKRPYNKDNNIRKPYNKPYLQKPRYNNTATKPEKEIDEDGFEKVVIKPKKTQTNYRYNNNKDGQRRIDNDKNEETVWESVTQPQQREGEDNNEVDKEKQNRNERPHRENKGDHNREYRGEQREYRGDKGEHRDRKDKMGAAQDGQKKESVWETESQFTEKKEKEVEVLKQPTKVEFTMKAKGLKDLFAKKK